MKMCIFFAYYYYFFFFRMNSINHFLHNSLVQIVFFFSIFNLRFTVFGSISVYKKKKTLPFLVSEGDMNCQFQNRKEITKINLSENVRHAKQNRYLFVSFSPLLFLFSFFLQRQVSFAEVMPVLQKLSMPVALRLAVITNCPVLFMH